MVQSPSLTCNLSVCRHHGAHSIHISPGCRDSGKRLRHVGHQVAAVPSDSPNDPYGSPRRNLEAAGIGGLRSQQGKTRMCDATWRGADLSVVTPHCDKTRRVWNRTRKFKNWLKSKNQNIYRSEIGPLFEVFMTLLDVESEGWIEREEMARSKGPRVGSNPSRCSAVVWSPAQPLSSAGTQTDGCQRSKLVLNPTSENLLYQVCSIREATTLSFSIGLWLSSVLIGVID